MTRVAIGPACPYPSWQWIGPELAGELADDHLVSVFDRFSSVPRCDVVLIVKQRPSAADVADLIGRGTRLIYVPVDGFASHDEIVASLGFLKACSEILSHSRRLAAHLAPAGRPVTVVEHQLRFALAELATRRDHGAVLWTGGFQHVPHLLAWLQDHPLDAEIELLTDLENPRAQRAAAQLAAELGVPLRIEGSLVNGLTARTWTPARLQHMMASCRAIIDIKGGGFNQSVKPATKAQQAVGSGIPFACNPGAAAIEELRDWGLELATPCDPDRWFGDAYRAETHRAARRLRRELSIQAVALPYRQAIARACAADRIK